jgi:hypothetical protein
MMCISLKNKHVLNISQIIFLSQKSDHFDFIQINITSIHLHRILILQSTDQNNQEKTIHNYENNRNFAPHCSPMLMREIK